MSKQKQLWLLAGGNGAGKSTFYRTQLAPFGMPFVNADIIAKELYPNAPEINSLKAAKIAEEIRFRLLREGRSFCFETVFSHPSKIDFIARAKAYHYQVIMVFIYLESSMLNKARVHQRVERGGHNVPEEKIEQRIPRALANFELAIPLCDQVRVLDNSSATNPFQQVLTLYPNRKHAANRVEQHREHLPTWLQVLR